MTQQQIQRLFEAVQQGKLQPQEAVERLKHLPFEDLGFAKIDHHRLLRQGMPEAVYAPGKTPEQVVRIVRQMLKRSPNVLVTRANRSLAARVKRLAKEARFHPLSGAISIHRDRTQHGKGTILVVSAGSSDIPVAEESVVTAELLGNPVASLYDVGVAGIHRLMNHREALASARVIICVAGMEGALPSVVAGLVAAPVIAVPTSVGYGSSFQGLAALLGMLNSCASNVAVVNIDNGFGAACFASMVNRI
ncbi:MAG: 1-(5-phosphoribosyl)-5-amino-4-imidazole-carboxylate carboxylase [Acidobacteria bacterium RIFCSPLOWO2_12_FULL_60_22]|nr:MAG: 1-(5-phosphoribosyl)-5-amino-4-imidazole-carboxylate carboxylase [Acidobacteria bacterium RIFCSPLOWO2_12_FULL_60_22]